MNSNSKIITISVIAAIYIVLCLILEPLSFGPLQFRLAEILCLLAIDNLDACFGLTLGTFIANLFFGGLGIVDVLMGTSATLIASLLAYSFRFRRIHDYPITSILCFVIVNALIVGSEFGIISGNFRIIPISMFEIGISEMVIMLIGLPLYPKIKEISSKYLNQKR